ncbi:hypothetical protein CK203_093268 [Vitis vinifera]|uniref:Uncharacterized protein n=1 Tax=Vitis vinifera TaxID=29760 RepID=A0A438CMD6_VITVI|nr:hypothetical protein CK203_093268 [Vitis vinifera]
MLCQVVGWPQTEMHMISVHRQVRNFLLSSFVIRVAPRRASAMIDTDQRQPKGWCKGFNENHQMVYEPLNGILGLRRGILNAALTSWILFLEKDMQQKWRIGFILIKQAESTGNIVPPD